MSNQSIFPFLPSSSTTPQDLSYDVNIGKAYPGLTFQPTEPNSQFQAIREVSGSLWLVTNADWNANTLRWEQNSPCNPANPAYATVLFTDGSQIRYSAIATEVAGNAVTWVQMHKITPDGKVYSSPLTQTALDIPADYTLVTWNAGTSVELAGREIDIVDTSSKSTSWIQLDKVNGVAKWGVDKNGVLQHGTVPYSAISGPFDNPTFTGTATFTGPAVFEDGFTADGTTTVQNLNYTGSITGPGGAPVSELPAFTQSAIICPAINSSVVIPISSTHGLPLGCGVVVAGTDGTSTKSFAGFVINNNGTPQTSITVQASNYLNGSPGDTMNSGGVVSFRTPVTISSGDGTIVPSNTGTTLAPIINLNTNLGNKITAITKTNSATESISLTLPGTTGFTFYLNFTAFVLVSSPTSSITVTATCTGSTYSGTATNWNQTATLSCGTQYVIPIMVTGAARGTDTVTATIGVSGATLVNFSSEILAISS